MNLIANPLPLPSSGDIAGKHCDSICAPLLFKFCKHILFQLQS